ncbi:TPA: M protein [Streptococcus pyogenes]
MAKNNTNRHYSLRKLKTGTASVAVALTVVGAGLVVNTHEVSANRVTRRTTRDELKAMYDRLDEQNHKLVNDKEALQKQITDLTEESKENKLKTEALTREIEAKKATLSKLESDLKTAEEEVQNSKEYLGLVESGHAAYHKRTESLIKEKTMKVEELTSEINTLEQTVNKANQELKQKENEISDLEQQLAVTKENAKKDFELAALGHQLADKEYNAKIAELESKLADAKKDFELAALGHQHAHNEYQAKLAEKDGQIKQLEEQKQILDASRKGTARDLEAVRQAKKATEAELNNLKAELAKVTEQKQILDASRQGLRRDLDASREAKKQVEKDLANLTAELDKVKEDKQISDASRQGLRRDLDASREAKKQVEKALEEANSKLAALEKLNKELEESKKLTEKEKAELQAKLEAEAKALKEQLAKQAEELAKLRAGKASDSQTPDTKPGNKAVPGKGQAPQAGTKPNQNKAPMKETKRQLPSTGESANPFFTAAALTVMATAGVAAVVKRKEEN